MAIIKDGALIQFSMPHVSFVYLLMYYLDFSTYPIPLDGIIFY